MLCHRVVSLRLCVALCVLLPASSRVLADSVVIYEQNFSAANFGTGSGRNGSGSNYVAAVNARNSSGQIVLQQGTGHEQWKFWSQTYNESGSPINQDGQVKWDYSGATNGKITSNSYQQGLIEVTSNSGGNGAVLILHDKNAYEGYKKNSTVENYFSLNEVILSIDLTAEGAGYDHANFETLELTYKEYSSDDEQNRQWTDGSGHQKADVIAISNNNGATWTKLAWLTDELNEWLPGSVNLKGLVTSNQFQIKFQQYGKYYHGSDGRKLDNILLTGNYITVPPGGGAVPEPGTMALFGIGLLGLATRKRWKKPVVAERA